MDLVDKIKGACSLGVKHKCEYTLLAAFALEFIMPDNEIRQRAIALRSEVPQGNIAKIAYKIGYHSTNPYR